MKTRVILTCLLSGFLWTNSKAQKISIDHFEGHEEWPLYVPGDLKVSSERLSQLRIEYDAAEMGGPGGPGFLLYMDVLDVVFRGKAADWIQWTFTPRTDDTERTMTPNLDLLIIDQESSELLFRLQPNGGPGNEWVSPYGFIQAMPDKIKQTKVDQNGNATLDSLVVDTPLYEFATLGFLFPFIDLEEHQEFRVKTYYFPSNILRNLAVKVVGKTTITDAKGYDHEAWAIDLLAPSQTTLVTYYVTKEAPYFYGWDYRTIEDGKSIFKMNYLGWTSTEVNKD